jgi:hypothetical protein
MNRSRNPSNIVAEIVTTRLFSQANPDRVTYALVTGRSRPKMLVLYVYQHMYRLCRLLYLSAIRRRGYPAGLIPPLPITIRGIYPAREVSVEARVTGSGQLHCFRSYCPIYTKSLYPELVR